MIKQRKEDGIRRNKKEKSTQEKNNTTWGNKPGSTGERRKTKEISTKNKTIQTKQDIPKQPKEILSTIEMRWHENIPTTECKRNWKILNYNKATKKHNKKAEW